MAAVLADGPTIAQWNFDHEVDLTAGNVPQFEVRPTGGGSWIAPVTVTTEDGFILTATYPSGVEPGGSWRIATAPTGISPATPVAWPQAGNVT